MYPLRLSVKCLSFLKITAQYTGKLNLLFLISIFALYIDTFCCNLNYLN